MTEVIDLETRRKKPVRGTKAPRRREGDNRPVIRLVVGELEQTVDEAEQALINADRGVYQRANILVGVGAAPAITADRQKINTPQILPLGEYRILELLMSSAAFEKYDGRANGFVLTNVPMAVVKAIEQRSGKFRFPPLTGIVNAPTMRSDGSLLTVPGYDASTGLFLDLGAAKFETISDWPTKASAASALTFLDDLLSGFPFVSEADRSVALAMILTAVVRRSLRTAPMFVFTAPVAGSGKSKLVDIASVIASGSEAGVISQGKKDDETEKRIASLLLAGSPIAIDNVETGIGGDLLCQLLTQTTVRLRILGQSQAPKMPTNVLVTATGNNVAVLGDMTRRTLVCRLDPGVERPELREFEFEPVAKAKAAREAYLVATLTVLRAYHCAGRPHQVTPLGSFEDWSSLIRNALLWLGRADPVETIEQGRAADPETEQLRAVMLQWKAVFGPAPTTAGEVVRIARSTERDQIGHRAERPDFLHPELRDALLAVAFDNGSINPTRLGIWLKKRSSRVIGGMMFANVGTTNGSARWKLQIQGE